MNYSHRSPKGNRHMQRLLNPAANAAARTKGSIFEIVYRRSVWRLGHNQAMGAIAILNLAKYKCSDFSGLEK